MMEALQLYRDVVAGNRAAVVVLLNDALDTLKASAADPVEMIASAELWARLAAVTGDATDERVLIGVLILRAGMDAERSTVDRDCHHAEALARLARLVDMGVPEVGGELVREVQEASPAAVALAMGSNKRAMIEAADAQYARLAAGDPEALDETVQYLRAKVGQDFASAAPSGENLALYAHVATMAAAAGRPGGWGAVAASLLYRAQLYGSRGDNLQSAEVCSRGIACTLQLADAGDADAINALPKFTAGLAANDLKAAVAAHPILLATMSPEGAC